MASSRRDEQPALPCPSWVWCTGSDVHIAKDRSWFSDDYTPIDSFLEGADATKTKVVGIGTVNLPTKISPKKTGPRSHGTLHLTNVLHIPSFISNVIGNPIMRQCRISTLGLERTSGTITRLSDGRPLAYFKPKNNVVKLFEIRLSGPPVGPKVGPSPFDPSALYIIHASWPDSERERVAALQNSRQSNAAPNGPLMPFEKAWLKEHFESDFKFLQLYGLSIHKEEDREEGRTILRAIMSNDEDEDSNDDHSDDESDEFNPEGHFADYHFSPEELDWIESNYGNSMHFMICFGLKFYKDEDCEEAKTIVRAMMANTDDSDSDDSPGVNKTA